MTRARKKPQPYRPRVPEKDLQVLVTDWLSLAGVLFTVTDAAHVVAEDERTGARTTRRSSVRKSWPDLNGVLPGRRGRMFAIETKAEDGRYQPGQPELLDELRREGVLVLVPRRLRDVVDAFEAEYIEDFRRREHGLIFRAIVAYHGGFGAK